MKSLVLIIGFIIVGLTVDIPKSPTFPGSPFKVEVVEAKTYYDQGTDSFKSVDETSGQTFNYSTGQYGQDYSR